MALKKSQLYSSLWQSCDELRGGMDASQYKDYVLTLLFMKYVSDKYAGKHNAVIEVPSGGSFADMVKLKGDKEIGEKIDKEHAQARTGIFMIDASKGFIKDGNKNRLRAEDIHRIVDVFKHQREVPRYARMVPISEIASPANDYNLNIPRYIDSSEPEDLHDLDAHLNGGIPNRDIDALDAYWSVFPSLRKSLSPDLIIERAKYKMDLIPPTLVVARYFAREQAAIDQGQAKLDEATQMLDEFVEENTGEEGLVEPQAATAQTGAKSKESKSHSWAFNEAVVISTLAKHFGKEEFPLGRKRYTKLSYTNIRKAIRAVGELFAEQG